MMFNPDPFCFTSLRNRVNEHPQKSQPLMKSSDISNAPVVLRTVLTILLCLVPGTSRLRAADTAFHYQGSLADDGQPAEDVYDLRFTLHASETGDDPIGQSYLALAVPVTNGLFATEIDLGPGLFNGETRWLEIAVRRSNAPNGFITLAPRQPVLAAPYALFALDAANATSATTVPWQGLTDVPEGFADGVDNNTLYSPGAGLDLTGDVFSVLFGGTGTADTAARGDHSHPASDADTLDGLDSVDFAPVSHGHDFAQITGQLSNDQLGTNVARLDSDQVFLGTNQFDGVVLLTNSANVVVATFAGDGAALTNLTGFSAGSVGPDALADGSVIAGKLAPNAVQAGQVAPDTIDSSQIVDATVQPADLALDQFDGSFWKVGGNTGAGSSFLGTLDEQPLELRVQGTRAFRLEPNETNGVNLVAGSAANVIEPGIQGATIAGGGSANYLGAPHVNRAGGDFATVSGGSRNVIEPTAHWSTIGGGLANAVRLNSQWSTIAGGNRNQIELDADGSAIVGGRTNTINGGASEGFIGGGAFNRILTNVTHASIPGGLSNTAGGDFSFAAGRQASALHDGAFVWSDNSELEQASTAENQFTIRASGGIRIFSNADSTTGVLLPAGEGTWSNLSDRDAKTEFAPVNARELLDRLTALPLQTWRYRSQTTPGRHLGPTAQDFHAQFNLGNDDRHIATIDADGVALAGIQGLNEKLEEELRRKEAEIEELRTKVDRLSARLDELLGLRATNP
jgi:hypothetical protein